MPRKPASAAKRSQDGGAGAASERAEGMDARSERPATGRGQPRTFEDQPAIELMRIFVESDRWPVRRR